jgi:hypothetical protein
MLPVQPPPKRLEVVKLTDRDDVQLEQRGELMFEDGVRMGTLYDLGYQAVLDSVTMFWISWPMFPDIDCQDYGWVCCSEDEDDEFGYDVTSKGESVIFTVSRGKREDVEIRRIPCSEFRSKGHEELDIALGKARLLAWDRHFDPVWNYDPNKYGM